MRRGCRPTRVHPAAPGWAGSGLSNVAGLAVCGSGGVGDVDDGGRSAEPEQYMKAMKPMKLMKEGIAFGRERGVLFIIYLLSLGM